MFELMVLRLPVPSYTAKLFRCAFKRCKSWLSFILSPLFVFINDVDDEFGSGFVDAATGTEGLRDLC